MSAAPAPVAPRSGDERPSGSLCHPLSDERILALAEQQLGPLGGFDLPCRCFVTGGLFKTLVHGRPPRDVDIWAPTAEDRELLVAHMLVSGAVLHRDAPYSQILRIAGREYDVPVRTEPSTAEERLARFDIAMAAVLVEVDRGEARVVVDPRAQESVDRREVLLLRPLANPRHCLSTLARLRRYAEELGWTAPAEEEAAIWAVFDAADDALQRGMLERYQLAAMPGWGVLEEARCRLRR